jgi:hypothetical protein
MMGSSMNSSITGVSSEMLVKDGVIIVSKTEAIEGAFSSGVVTLTSIVPSAGTGEMGRGVLIGVA